MCSRYTCAFYGSLLSPLANKKKEWQKEQILSQNLVSIWNNTNLTNFTYLDSIKKTNKTKIYYKALGRKSSFKKRKKKEKKITNTYYLIACINIWSVTKGCHPGNKSNTKIKKNVWITLSNSIKEMKVV